MAAACAATGGCSGHFRDALAKRAVFDLSCPRDEMVFTELSHNGVVATSYGVQGCSKRAVYLFNTATHAWILNSLESKDDVAASGTGRPPG